MSSLFSRLLCVVLVFSVAAGGAGPWAQETPPPAEPAPAAAEAPQDAVTLTLEEVLRSALEKNLDIAVRRYDPQVAGTRIETEESLFSPTLDLSAKDSENTAPTGEALAGGSVVTDSNRSFSAVYGDSFKIGSTFTFQVVANRGSTTSNLATINPSYYVQALATYRQSLLRDFGLENNRTGITIARNNQEISRWQFRQTVMNTLADAEKAYWDLNLALMNLKTANAYLKLAQDFLDQTRIKVRVGTLPPIEITQAEAEVANREEAVINSQTAIGNAEDNLRRLMNIPPDSPAWSQAIIPAEEPQVLDKMVNEEEAIRTALEKRPDLEQARLDLANREAELRYRKNQKLYRLDLVAQYGAQGLSGDTYSVDFTTVPPASVLVSSEGFGEAVNQVGRRDFDTWSAEIQLGIPLGNRAAEAAYAAAHFEQDRSRLGIEQLQQNARVEVRNAVRQLESSLKRTRSAQVNTRLQLEKLDAEQKKYENGMSTAFQILQFQTDLANAKARENQAMVDYNKSLVELDRVLGILLETRNVTVSE